MWELTSSRIMIVPFSWETWKRKRPRAEHSQKSPPVSPVTPSNQDTGLSLEKTLDSAYNPPAEETHRHPSPHLLEARAVLGPQSCPDWGKPGSPLEEWQAAGQEHEGPGLQAAGADHQGNWTDGPRKREDQPQPCVWTPRDLGVCTLGRSSHAQLLSGQWPQEGLCVPQPPGPADRPLLRHRRRTWPRE